MLITNQVLSSYSKNFPFRLEEFQVYLSKKGEKQKGWCGHSRGFFLSRARLRFTGRLPTKGIEPFQHSSATIDTVTGGNETTATKAALLLIQVQRLIDASSPNRSLPFLSWVELEHPSPLFLFI